MILAFHVPQSDGTDQSWANSGLTRTKKLVWPDFCQIIAWSGPDRCLPNSSRDFYACDFFSLDKFQKNIKKLGSPGTVEFNQL